REETALSQAVALPNINIIEPPESRGPVSPMPLTIYLTSLAMGLIIPLSYLVLREYTDDAVKSPQDIKKQTSVPFLGNIGLSKSGKDIVVSAKSRSAIAEMFRMLRTNLQFMIPGSESKTILLTSSMSGEGKTFITVNLGISLAIS